MVPLILFQIALIIIIVRSIYVVAGLINLPSKRWLDILFHLSIAIVCLQFLL